MAVKRGRKSAADKAAEVAAKELEIAQVVVETKEVIELEPVSEAPVEPVEPISDETPGGDISNTVEIDTDATQAQIDNVPEDNSEDVLVETLVEEIAKEIHIEGDFRPILRPTSVAGEPKGYIACPKAVFNLVQTKGWQDLIESHPAKHALKSVLYWKNINGTARVRCMSSSRFADVV